MRLTEREQERLMISVAADLAWRRRGRGLRLNYPETVAVLTSFVLEGARASVVISPEPGVLLTPPPAAPVLPGTTVDALYDAASRAGWRCEHGWLTVADLRAAQGVWLLSSVTLAARVHTLDGVGLAAAPQDADVSALVAAAIG